jgi:nucleoside phosphorylase
MLPEALLEALTRLQVKHERQTSEVSQVLRYMLQKNPQMARSRSNKSSHAYQERANDKLFNASNRHIGGGRRYENCDSAQEIVRGNRESNDLEIHYGTIASRNTLMKSSATRDANFENDETCICLETEAAGLMITFPCILIRRICDYADSHKEDRWQRYAGAAAAAYAKESLKYVDIVDLTKTQRAIEALRQSQSTTHRLSHLTVVRKVDELCSLRVNHEPEY